MWCSSRHRFSTGAIARTPVLLAAAAVVLPGCGGASSGHAAQQGQGQTSLQQSISTSVQKSSQAVLAATAKPDPRHRREPSGRPGQHASAATAAQKTQRSRPQQTATAHPQARPQQNAQSGQARQQPSAQTHHTASRGTASSHPSAQAELAKFKQSYEPVIGQLTGSSHAIGAALRGAASSTGGQLLSTFRGLASRWQVQLGRLESLKSPANLAPEFDAVTSAARRIASNLGAVIAAVASRDKAAGGRAVTDLVNDLIAARSADAALQQRLPAA